MFLEGPALFELMVWILMDRSGISHKGFRVEICGEQETQVNGNGILMD